jgi:hypothetical protein
MRACQVRPTTSLPFLLRLGLKINAFINSTAQSSRQTESFQMKPRAACSRPGFYEMTTVCRADRARWFASSCPLFFQSVEIRHHFAVTKAKAAANTDWLGEFPAFHFPLDGARAHTKQARDFGQTDEPLPMSVHRLDVIFVAQWNQT